MEAGERGHAGEGRGEGGGVSDGGEVDVGYAGAGGEQEVALGEGAGEVGAAVEEEVADVLIEEGEAQGMARDGGGQRGGGGKRVPARRDRVSTRVLSEGAFFVAYDDNVVEQRLEPAMRNEYLAKIPYLDYQNLTRCATRRRGGIHLVPDSATISKISLSSSGGNTGLMSVNVVSDNESIV